MKTLRKMKKGFTIVELVIVIAVIAVLTAILVPTFISISNKANETSDKSLVKNLNTALRVSEVSEGKNKTLHDAVLDVDEYGYKLSNLVTKSGEKLLWNEDNDEFVIDDGREDYKNVKYWEICSEMPADSNKHSVYAGDNWAETNSAVTVKDRGFDVGYNVSIKTVTYVDQNDSADTVTIRTNGADEKLSIDAPKDTIQHFGIIGEVSIPRTADGSYHENKDSKAGYIQVASGRVVSENGGYINTVVLTEKGSGATLPAVIEIKNGGVIVNKYATSLDVASANNAATSSYQLDIDDDPTTGKLINESEIAGVKSTAIASLVPTPEGKGISSLAELQAAFANGGEYYLLKDIDVDTGIVTSTEVVIDFNGHHLNVNSPAYQDYGCVLVASGSSSCLTFKDFTNGSGGVLNVSDSINDAVIGNFYGGRVVFESGSFVSTENALFGGISMGGSVVINGGSLNGYFDAVIGLTFYVNVTCSFRYYEENGSVPFSGGFMAQINPQYANTIVTGPGVTQTGGDVNSYDTTFTFVKA